MIDLIVRRVANQLTSICKGQLEYREPINKRETHIYKIIIMYLYNILMKHIRISLNMAAPERNYSFRMNIEIFFLIEGFLFTFGIVEKKAIFDKEKPMTKLVGEKLENNIDFLFFFF